MHQPHARTHSRPYINSRESVSSSLNSSLASSNNDFVTLISQSRPETPHAVVRIQEAWRYRGWHLDRVSATLRLQCWYRGIVSRQVAAARAARAFQSKFLIAMMGKDNPVRIRMQKALAFDKLVTFAEESRGAVRFQSMFRGTKARRRSMELVEEKRRIRLQLENASALIIQCATRIMIAHNFVAVLRMSISHMTKSKAVHDAINALVISGGHKHCHWRRCRALSLLETFTQHWARESGASDGGYRMRKGLGLWLLAEMRRRNAPPKSLERCHDFFASESVPLAAFGRRDWPSGQLTSMMCVKRGRYYVLSAHWQYLTEARLAGVAVVGEEEAQELFPDPPGSPHQGSVGAGGDDFKAKKKTTAAAAEPPGSPRGTLISILRRGSRRGRARQNRQDGDGSEGGSRSSSPQGKNKLKKKKKNKRSKKRSGWFKKIKKEPESACDDKAVGVKALPLRCLPLGRVHLLMNKMLGSTYKKLYKNKPGFDGISLEEYCERYPAIFDVRYDVREIALVLKDDEEDSTAGIKKDPNDSTGGVVMPAPKRSAFDFYCDEWLKKSRKKRANKGKSEQQLRSVARSKWQRMGKGGGRKRRPYETKAAKDEERFQRETKAFNDQAVLTGVKKIDPLGVRPARLPFELHVRAMALDSASLRGRRRRKAQLKVLEKSRHQSKEKRLEEQMLAEAMQEMAVPVISAKNKKAEKKRRAERAALLKEEAALRAEDVAREEAEDERIRKQWALEEMEEEEEDALRREEAAAFWYCNKYNDRPTSSWCDVRLSVALGQESGGGRVKNVDLDAVSMDSLEATIFSSIPLKSRILRIAVVRSEIDETTQKIDEKGNVKPPRLCCICRLSDIQSVLCLRRKYRLGTLTTQTVHGHVVKVRVLEKFCIFRGVFPPFSRSSRGVIVCHLSLPHQSPHQPDENIFFRPPTFPSHPTLTYPQPS